MDSPAAPKPIDAARAAPRAPWTLLLLLMAMSAIGPVSLTIIVPALPGLVGRLASDTKTIQLAISLYLVGLAVSQLLLGPLSDRFGRRPVLLAGLSLTALSSVAAIAAASAEGLIAARVIQSLGASTGLVVGRAIIRDLFERERAASMIGLVATVMVAAPMVAPLIGGILDTAFGWEAIFLFVALFSAAIVIWAAFALPETRPERAAGPKGQFFRELGALSLSANFWGYVLAGAFGSATFFVFLGGGPHVVVSIMGRTSAEYGLWFAMASFGYMTGNFLASRLSLRHGINLLIWIGTAIEIAGAALAVALAAFLPDGGPAIVFLPQLVISIGNGLMLPNAIAGAISVRPQAAGTASGITGFSQMAIGAAGAQTVGYLLVGATSPLPMALMLFGFAVATAVAFGLLVRRAEGGAER